MNTGYQTASLGNLFGLPYVVMRKPTPIDTTTLNYNWQIWETNAFSIYTKETDEVDEQSAQEAVAAVLRYLSRVGLLRYHCHSGYLSTVVQENEMANVLTPAGGIFRRFVEPGQEVEYGQKMGVILEPFTAEVEAEITCPTSGVVFFALKKPLTTGIYLDIEEPGLLHTFWDFCETLDDTLFYTTTEAIEILRDLIEQYKELR